MCVLSREELLNKINTILGDNSTTDDGLSLIEDITDTYNDLASKGNTDWEKRYNENDKAWREKYRARFMSPTDSDKGGNSPKDNDKDIPLDEGEEKEKLEALTYDKLFTTKSSNDDKKEE